MSVSNGSLLILSLDWSDGVATWQGRVNGPTDDMLDATPDANDDQDYFCPVVRRSPKEIYWLLKLAMWLVETKDPELFNGKTFILAALPAGYRLYEHVRVPGPVSSTLAPLCPFSADCDQLHAELFNRSV